MVKLEMKLISKLKKTKNKLMYYIYKKVLKKNYQS